MATWQETQKRIIESIVGDIDILSGDVMGPSDATWQDVAGSLSCNLQVLSAHIEKIRKGDHPSADASDLTTMGDQLRKAVK